MASFWDSLKYVGKKFKNGVVRSVEGIADFAVGGIADFIGQDDYAEHIFGNDWIDYEEADREYAAAGGNIESGFWKVAGDVMGGIGSSVPALAASLATAGVGTGAALFATGATAFATGAGTGVSDAYKETGRLDAKAYGYGSLSGATEAGLEMATMGIGKGITAAGRSLGKELIGESGESAVKSLGKATAKSATRNGFVKTITGDMMSEGIEEGFSEFLDPYWKRATIDPNAEKATFQQIGYAALVGALSGGVTTSVTTSVGKGANMVSDLKNGSRAVENGTTEEIINAARYIAEFEQETGTGFAAPEDIVSTLNKLDESLKTTGGKVTTAAQKRMVGRLERDTVATVGSQLMFSSVESVLNNADAFVQQYNSLGLKGADGQALQITKEQLLDGIDFSGGKNTNKSIAKALRNNATLRSVAAQDAAGRLMLDAAAYKNAVLSGQAQVTTAWLENFKEKSSDAEYADFSQKLGLDLENATASEVRAAVKKYMSDPANAAVIEQIKTAKKIAPEKAKALPKRVGFERDGVRRYNLEGTDIAVMKSGNTYRVYEYDTGDVSRALASTTELNKFLNEARRVASEQNAATASINVAESANAENVGASENRNQFNLNEGLNAYTEQDVKSITQDSKNKIATSYSDVINFISDSLNDKTNGRLFLGKIKSSEAVKIKEKTDVSAFGKSLVLTSDEIKHIFKQHGNQMAENLRGQEAITLNNFSSILETIISPSDVIPETDNNGAISLVFSKVINGKTTAVTIVSEKKRALTLKSARINRKGQYISPPSDVQAPNPTPESEWSMNTNPSVVSIPESEQKVNIKTKNSEKNSSKAAKETLESANAENVGVNAGTSSTVETAQSTSFRNKIDAWDGKTEGFAFILGNTSTAIANIEVKGKKIGKKQIRIDATKIKKILEKHKTMNIDIIKKLPDVVNNPIVIADSKTVENRLVLFGEIYDLDNHPVMVALELNPVTRKGTSTYVDIIKIASAYGKSNLQNILNTSNIRYVNENKNRVEAWLKVNRLQLPLPNSQADSANNSIPQNVKKVNRKTEISENSQKNTDTKTERAKRAEADDKLLREKVKAYREISAPAQTMVRKTLRDARRAGLSEAEALTYAAIAARSGVLVEFDAKSEALVTKYDENGNAKYADGVYLPGENKIVINPEGTRSAPRALIHELMHAIYKSFKGNKRNMSARIFTMAKKNLSESEKTRIEKDYNALIEAKQERVRAEAELTGEYLASKFPKKADKIRKRTEKGGEKVSEAVREDIIRDETAAYYAEKVFTNKHLLESLVSERPSTVDKILSFFKGAAESYSDNAELSRAAKRFERQFSKMFDEFSARNKGRNAVESVTSKVDGDEQFALPYGDAIDKLKSGTLDTTQNTHLRVLDYTPQIYLDKAEASNREIVMSWDVAYLAMNKNGSIPGNYHGLGVDIMKALPAALEDPLYIVKQKNGRIAAVTKIVVKGKRAVFASIELEAYQTTIQEGEPEAKRYNLVVTVTDAKPNYLQNTIFSGEIVYNKNSEDPAHFILRLKSLKKAVPTYDLAGSSDNSISQKSNLSTGNFQKLQKTSEDKRFALPVNDIAEGSIERLERKSFKEKAQETVDGMKSGFVPGILATEIQLTNAQAGIEHAGRKLGVKDVESLVQRCRASTSMAQEMLGGGQWLILPGAKSGEAVKLGEGLEPILSEIRDRRKGESREDADKRYTAYQYYLYHKHNVDRMSLEKRSIERNEANVKKLAELEEKESALGKKLAADEAEMKALARNIKDLKREIETFKPEADKPVLRRIDDNGKYVAVTAQESEAAIAEYEKRYSEFKDNSERIYKFLNNLLEMQVKYGLIDRKTYNYLREKYPHYVPTFRAEVKMGTAAVRGKGNIEVAQTVKTATGSLEALEDLELSISRMVQRVVRAGNVNVLANKLYDAALASGDTSYIKEVSRQKSTESLLEGDGELERPKKNQVNIYRDGERITLAVTSEVFSGFDDFNTKEDAAILPIRAVSKLTSGFKVLVTSANPIFLVRNFIRDLQDAGINTKYGKVFLKNYARAIYHLSHNTEVAQLYRAAGGFNSSLFDYADGFTGKQSKMGFTNPRTKAKWLLAKIENANMFIEQLPRFAEFISSIEAGASVDQAILNAADVTTNFGRSGKLTRKLNSTIIPFLNPAVQGFSKVYRNIKDGFRSKKAFTSLVIKCAILGILPMVLNNLLYSDDEEYEDVRDTDKENNYLFRVGDTWIKIPKGRFVSVLAGAANRTTTEISGGDADWKEYFFENVLSQITPVENFTRPIWSPFTDIANNKTWYGGEIEGRQFDNVRPRDRYDESTSSIAIAIGKVTGWSPKKIHYVLDQYSGVVGDFLLPATTQKAEKNFAVSAFIFDPVTNNKLSDEFYDLYEEAQYRKNDGDVTAEYQLKHLNDVKSKVSKLYDDISEIQSSDLPSAEKLQKTRTIRILINNLYKTAKTDYAAYTAAIESTAGAFEETTDSGKRMRHVEITRRMYGAEKAFEEWNTQTYDKMKLVSKSGVDFEKLYTYYFSVKDLENDYDKNGDAVPVSRKKKVAKVVNSLGVSKNQKLLLLSLSGFSVGDDKKTLLNFILSLSISKDEKLELAKACGFSVKNGKIQS